MRGITVLLLLLVGQGSREERGKYKLSYFGREAGTEEYRLEELEDGQVVLFSKAKFEVDVRDRKTAFVVDSVLTMDRDFAPLLYAGYQKIGPEERRVKIEWRKGQVFADGRKPVKTAASFALDDNVNAHLLPILRRFEGGKKKLKVFRPAPVSDLEIQIEDKGEAMLRRGDRALRAREFQLIIGYLDVTAHLDEKKRLIRVSSPTTGALAELEGFEGLSPEARRSEGVEELEVRFPSGALTLAGAVTKARGAKACLSVVLLSGAGPHDRDGNAILGKGGEPISGEGPGCGLFRRIAYTLSESGVLVLRFDDRGCGASEGQFAAAKLSDFAADARAAVAFLRAREDVATIGLAGQGEGGLVALLVAGGDERIRAVFLLAAVGKTLDILLLESAERSLREQGTKEEVLQEILAKQRRLFADIRKAPGDTFEIDERPTFIGWMRERFACDPPAEIAKVKAPVVILQGTKDRQVTAENAELLQKGRPDAELKRFEGLDHFFMRTEGRGVDAAGPDRRVDGEFLKFLTERVLKLLK